MICNEIQAKEKFCHRTISSEEKVYCVASSCMAWCWSLDNSVQPNDLGTRASDNAHKFWRENRRGYCGLINEYNEIRNTELSKMKSKDTRTVFS